MPKCMWHNSATCGPCAPPCEPSSTPWWVEGAEVHGNLEMLSTFCMLAKFTVQVDNDNGFCLREQLWYDAVGFGINTDAGKRIRKASRFLRGKRG